MTNEKDIIDDQELDEEFLFTMKEIQRGLDTVDQGINMNSPNIEWFENLVEEEKQKLKKKLIFDVSLFAIVALLILSGILFALYSVPMVFVAVQGLAIIFIIAHVSVQHFKKVKET
ncbi:YxlC family protein [Bacillus sp. S/N-304-OC-R1]|uniref:YxlC family protein n=1 Tax=Bacillus sp. S/N-304-OC-R1 TaxID=2758034 RepID=UPI001C8DA46A|nr:YxlC family protein [Bacillus sp. S/N-304-OC-R1]MBY0123109.1 YxlC family protein [Bacillus sp. S/N-304-OC-R1]